ncbi:MAG: DUF1579 family protein [Vicinamibacterales bacterium]
MAALDRMAALGGPWQATYQLRGDPSFDGDSPTTASVTPMVGHRFVRIDYTWSEHGKPQEGALIVAQEPKTGEVTAAWMDTWHNGHRMMLCTGSMLPDGGIDVRGTYPDGVGGEEWGWRTRILVADDAWTLTMFNVSPDGREALAVNANYRRG